MEQKQVEQYRSLISEMFGITHLIDPTELNLDNARQELTHILFSKMATATKQTRVMMVCNLFAIGVMLDLLNEHPFPEERTKSEKEKG